MKTIANIATAAAALALIFFRLETIRAAESLSAPRVIPAPALAEFCEGTFEFSPDMRIIAGEEAKTALAVLAGIFGAEATASVLPAGSECPQGAGCVSLLIDPSLAANGPESYELSVAPEGAELRAPSPAGLFYAAQTLRQMLPPEPGSGASLPCVKISDAPRFRWRGLMLDVSRHFFPKEFVFKMMDAMAALKMNTLHIHLTDDQGWRLEIEAFPALTKTGAWRGASSPADELSMSPAGPAHGGFYTKEDMREIIRRAAELHITIAPEIEMPGHAVAAIASVPGLSCKGERLKVSTRWGVHKDVYCAGSERVFEFLETVLGEVAELFPGEIIHVGGDEVPKHNWRQCPKCQERIRAEGLANEEELQGWFMKRIEDFLESRGKRIIGWDEIVEGGLPPRAAVMSWRGMEGGIAAAIEGHDVVMSPTSHCYFDYMQAETGEPRRVGRPISLEKVYSFEPVPAALAGTPAAERIMGAQGNIWTEYIDSEEMAEYMTWPRGAALAEAVWSPAESKDYAGFLARLENLLPHFDAMGVNYRRPGPEDGADKGL
jgi:hexosaminidase